VFALCLVQVVVHPRRSIVRLEASKERQTSTRA
jgi:hypothetical protein